MSNLNPGDSDTQKNSLEVLKKLECKSADICLLILKPNLNLHVLFYSYKE